MGTMKRKLKWLAVVLVVLLLGFGTVLLLWPRDRITAESWQKIQIGMSEKEVEEILGGSGMTWKEARDQNARLEKELGRIPFEIEGPRLVEPDWSLLLWGQKDRVRIWNGRRGIITIDLDQDNHVSGKEFQGVRWTNAGIIDRLRDWLGW
jgi:hypothetical protein